MRGLAIPLAGVLVATGVAVASVPAVAAASDRFTVRYEPSAAWARTLPGDLFAVPGRAQPLKETPAGWVTDSVAGDTTGRIVPGHGLRTRFQVRNTSGERMRLAVFETGPALSAAHPVEIVLADPSIATPGRPRDAQGCRLAGQTVLEPGQVLDVVLDARFAFSSVRGREGTRTSTPATVTVAAAQEASSAPFTSCAPAADIPAQPSPTSPTTDPSSPPPGETDAPGTDGYWPGADGGTYYVPPVAVSTPELARTGADVGSWVAAGAALVGAGGGLLLAARRRRRADDRDNSGSSKPPRCERSVNSQ